MCQIPSRKALVHTSNIRFDEYRVITKLENYTKLEVTQYTIVGSKGKTLKKQKARFKPSDGQGNHTLSNWPDSASQGGEHNKTTINDASNDPPDSQ